MTVMTPSGPLERAMECLQGGGNRPQRWVWKRLKLRYSLRASADFDRVVAGLGPGDICLDLGANLGMVSERLGRTGATVHAYEPDPYIHERASERLKDLANVHLHNVAVGAEAGQLTLYRERRFERDPERYGEGTTLHPSPRRTGWVPNGEVEVLDFFDLIASFDRPVTLVKMDIEGAEWDILERLFSEGDFSRLENLFVETHERSDYARYADCRRFRQLAANVGEANVNLYWH